MSVNVECFGTETVPLATIEKLVSEHFDLRPGAIIRDLDLQRPIYAKTASYGHFGRDDRDFTWERTDKADALREAAGLALGHDCLELYARQTDRRPAPRAFGWRDFPIGGNAPPMQAGHVKAA